MNVAEFLNINTAKLLFQKKNKNTAKNIILAVAVTFFWQFTARQ